MAETMAILVGGGPAPGINGVIAAATIEAINSGMRVVGIYDGYKHLVEGGDIPTLELTIDLVTRLQATGGSMLRTSRTNPAKDEGLLANCVSALDRLGVRYLVTIGGDDTTFGALRIAETAKGRIGVACVPKTIDNDLPLPDNAPTFGFETARSVGSQIIESLIEDARTTTRWYFVVSMGRTSGALALGMCRAAGATLAIIPEEFGDAPIRPDDVVDVLAGAIVKRRASGHDHGVAIIAEGIAERLGAEAFEGLPNVARDAYGHVRLADVPLGTVLKDAVVRRLEKLAVDATVVAKDIGYELRCAKPVPFDVEYTRTLGYGAVKYLQGGGSGALIALSGGRVVPLALDEIRDPQTGRVRIRRVDVTTESYEVARSYMIRLERGDFEDARLERLASETNLSPARFRESFERTVMR